MTAMLALTDMQPIFGVDMHMSIPPTPPCILPHSVVWRTGQSLAMGLPLAFTASGAMSPEHSEHKKKPIALGFGFACSRGHDAGPHLGHFAANTLLAIIWLGAASKSEFGSSTVRVQNEDIAINLGPMSPQLHCNDPILMPTGLTIPTSSNMVYVGFTLKDFLSGLSHMLVDIALGALLNFILGASTNLLKGQLKRLFSQGASKGVLTVISEQARSIPEGLQDIFGRRLKYGSGALVMEWGNLSPRGFYHQTQVLWNNLKSDEFFTRDLPGPISEAVLGTALALDMGGPAGAEFRDPNAPVQPATQASKSVNKAIDSLFGRHE
jgi:hypothetical protein